MLSFESVANATVGHFQSTIWDGDADDLIAKIPRMLGKFLLPTRGGYLEPPSLSRGPGNRPHYKGVGSSAEGRDFSCLMVAHSAYGLRVSETAAKFC